MQAKDAMFESTAIRDTRAIAWVKRACRMRESSVTISLSPHVLKRFTEGKAVVRATVIRRQQLGRHPAPVVTERVVSIQRD